MSISSVRCPEELGHPRLGEEHVPVAQPGVGAGQQNPGCELLGARDLGRATGPRHGVERPALPGQAAEHGLAPVVQPDQLGGRQRAHDVAPAPHADHQRAPGTTQQQLGVTHPLVVPGAGPADVYTVSRRGTILARGACQPAPRDSAARRIA